MPARCQRRAGRAATFDPAGCTNESSRTSMLSRVFVLRERAAVLALIIAAFVGAPASSARAAPFPTDPRAAAPTAELTERDVAASNAKIRMAYSDLAAMWGGGVAQL